MADSIFREFQDTMAKIYLKYYLEHGKEKCLDFCLKNCVSVYILINLYVIFVLEGLDEIEKIDQDKKQKYWDLAGTYFTDKEERIKASKIIYTMELIAGNF